MFAIVPGAKYLGPGEFSPPLIPLTDQKVTTKNLRGWLREIVPQTNVVPHVTQLTDLPAEKPIALLFLEEEDTIPSNFHIRAWELNHNVTLATTHSKSLSMS